MIKFITTALLTLTSAMAFAAVDANKATQAELEAVKGIGPSMATRILDARQASAFKDWTDFAERVKGVGPGNAAKFSADGMTVAGAPFTAAPAAAAKLPRKAAQVPDTKK